LKQYERSTRSAKITKYRHKGFDFDGAAGHDLLVTDSLKNRFIGAFNHQFRTGPQMFGITK
jgi:hypothetical protein